MKNLGPQFEVKGGILKLFEDDENNFVALKASATLAGDITFTLPIAQPAVSGYVLACTTAGVMSWVANGTPVGANLTAGTGLTFPSGTGVGAVLVAVEISLSAGAITSLGLADTAVQPARQIISGAGLTGGGDLSANRTLAVGAGNGITVNADDVAVNLAYAFTWSAKHTFTQASGNTLIAVRTTGDTQDKFYIYQESASVGLYWGDGSTAGFDAGIVRHSEGYLLAGYNALAGGLLVVAGAANQPAIVGGIIHTAADTVTAAASETTLHTFTLGGNFFTNVGDIVTVEAFGDSTATSGLGVARVDLYFDGTSYCNFSGAAGVRDPYYVKATFIMQSSSVLAYVITMQAFPLSSANITSGTITGLDFTTSKEIKTTGRSTDGSNVPREFAFLCGFSSAGIN